ncbi:MAG TPA: GNAT family N-acetyltransferase [Gammaproteobacteria bacterium]
MILETARLSLRAFTTDDAPFVLRLLNEPAFIENIADKGVRTLEDARSYLLNGPMASYLQNGFGLWLVVTKDDGVPVGMCGLIKRDMLDDVDVGYALLTEFSGRGYALEAASAVHAHARAHLKMKRLVAVVNSGNVRSIRLLEKLGFRFERMVRMPGDDKDIRLLASDL